MNGSRLPAQGDVWRIDFVYEDDPSLSKKRPVVVAIIEEGQSSAIVVKITGHGPRPEFPGEVRIGDWADAGLSKPSTVRCSKSLVIDLAVFTDAEYYGHLSQEDEIAVANGLHDAGILTEAPLK